jgi:CxxC-x17-CxxC domain-containing protein
MKEEKEEGTEEEQAAEEEKEEQAEEERAEEEQTGEEAQEGERKDKFGRTLYKVKCSDCGKETEVPFKPSGDRPVYCRECYQKHRPRRRF